MVNPIKEWKTYKFKDYFTLLPTNTLSRDKLSDRGEIGNIHYGDVLIKYGCLLSDESVIPRIKEPTEIPEQCFLSPKDVIITDTAEDETVGKAVQIGDLPVKIVSGLHTIACRPKYDTALGFLGYFINSKQYHNQLLPLITGIKVASLAKKTIAETELFIPQDVEEQAVIANALSSFDEYIADLDALIAKKKAVRDGALEDLMSGRTRLAGYEKRKIKYRKIKDLYKRIKGSPITADLMKSINTENGNIRVFAGGATRIKTSLANLSLANITTEPVVIVQSRGIIDFIYCDEPCTFKNEMWGYTSDDINAVKFLYYYLKQNVGYFRNAGDGRSSFPQISLKVTEEYIIPLLSSQEHTFIVSILSAMDEEIAALESEREKTIQIREGAMDDLLTGRVRLKI